MDRFLSAARLIQSVAAIAVAGFICAFLFVAFFFSKLNFFDALANDWMELLLSCFIVYACFFNMRGKGGNLFVCVLFLVVEVLFFIAAFVACSIEFVFLEIYPKRSEGAFLSTLEALEVFLGMLREDPSLILKYFSDHSSEVYQLVVGWPVAVFATWLIVYLARGVKLWAKA